MELDKIKKIELDILKATVEILNRHNMPYYLAYGSCIGAVRHHGFIPWDDDIDIVLFRKDYEKARIILQKELPQEYIYCDHTIENDYPYNFGKVRLKKSAFVQASLAHLHINHGIYIDIFPLDNCYDTYSKTKRILNKIRFLRSINDISIVSYKKYDKLRPLWQLPLIFLTSLFVNSNKLRNKIDKLCKSGKDNSEYVCSYLTPYGSKDIYKRCWFGIGKKIQFEDCVFMCPENTDAYLSHIYGDYMQLPPEEKRVPHHDIIYSSLDTEYNPSK